ncbi:hypothetical protein N9M68_04110 [Candidatus Poseidonia alphae]|nr:hypothetical protein [Candidatus Poseidonia alphae]
MSQNQRTERPLSSVSNANCEDCNGVEFEQNSDGSKSCLDCGLVIENFVSTDESDNAQFVFGEEQQTQLFNSNQRGIIDLSNGKDSKGIVLDSKTKKLFKRLNQTERRTRRTNASQYRENRWKQVEELIGRAYKVPSESEMMAACKEIFQALTGKNRHLKNTNSIRGGASRPMKNAVLAAILIFECGRDARTLEQKLQAPKHRYSSIMRSEDVRRILQEFEWIFPTYVNGEVGAQVGQDKVTRYILKVFKAMNNMYVPLTKEAQIKAYGMEDDERRKALVEIHRFVMEAYPEFPIDEKTIELTSEVLKQTNRYPSFRSPNHLRSCHVEVLYQVARGLNPSYKITRPKLVRAISVDSNETTKRKIRTQDAWRSLAKEVALMVVEIHG